MRKHGRRAYIRALVKVEIAMSMEVARRQRAEQFWLMTNTNIASTTPLTAESFKASMDSMYRWRGTSK